MIKKIFVGVLLAGAFGLLVLGAVNRTLAKTNHEPLALSENKVLGGNNTGHGNGTNGSGNGSNKNLTNSENTSNGLGRNSNDNLGSGQNNRQGSSLGDGTGVGLANVQSWEDPITVTVVSMDTEIWFVSNNEGFELEIEGRTLRFLIENGFAAEIGDELVLVGFYEGDDFEVGHITNNATQQELTVREASGRPLWAGGGR